MYFCKSPYEYIKCPSWDILLSKQLFMILKIAPTQNEQHESNSLLVLPLKPPNQHCLLLSHSVNLAISIQCNLPKALSAAIPQQVYPPCAYPPYTFDNPPSYVCEAMIFSATPSSKLSSRCNNFTMIVTMQAALRSVYAPIVISNLPYFLQDLKNLVSPSLSSKWYALGPIKRMVRNPEQVGAKCGNCKYPPPKPPYCQFQQYFNAFVISLREFQLTYTFKLVSEFIMQQYIHGCPQSKNIILFPILCRIDFKYASWHSLSRVFVWLISTFFNAYTTYFSYFFVSDIYINANFIISLNLSLSYITFIYTYFCILYFLILIIIIKTEILYFVILYYELSIRSSVFLATERFSLSTGRFYYSIFTSSLCLPYFCILLVFSF